MHGSNAPWNVSTYTAPVVADFWDEAEDADEFERWWALTESGPAWEQGHSRAG